MGRHSAAPAATPRTPSPAPHPDAQVFGPVTDPVLLDAIQEELRQSRGVPEPAREHDARAPYRRPAPEEDRTQQVIRTAYSGEVVLPARPAGRDPLRTVRLPEEQPATRAPRPAPRRSPGSPGPRRAPAPEAPAPQPGAVEASGTLVSPVAVPVPPHPAVTSRLEVPTVAAPLAGAAGLPVDTVAPRDRPEQRIGISGQSLVLCLGVGIGIAAALSIVAVLPI